MILVDHFINLQQVIEKFDFIIAIDDVAHSLTPSIDESKTQIAENDFYNHLKDSLSIFQSFVDDNGVTQFVFCRPFDTHLYYISSINRGYDSKDKIIIDSVIFQFVCGDMEEIK